MGSLTRDSIPGSGVTPWAEGGANPLRPRGSCSTTLNILFKCSLRVSRKAYGGTASHRELGRQSLCPDVSGIVTPPKARATVCYFRITCFLGSAVRRGPSSARLWTASFMGCMAPRGCVCTAWMLQAR